MTTLPDLNNLALGMKAPDEPKPEEPKGDLFRIMQGISKILEALEPRSYKGEAVRILSGQSVDVLSDKVVDVRGYNAVHVQVIVSGATPSSIISIEGSIGSGGTYILLPNTTQSAITANTSFNATVGAEFIKVRMASTSGTFLAGQGFTIIVIPYIA